VEDDLTPCWKRDEWTRDSNHMTPKAGTQGKEDFEAGIRAQLICFTRCPKRQECFDLAMSLGEDNDWFIWGGYTGAERARIRETGAPLSVPATAQKFTAPNMDRINMVIDSAAPFDDLAEHWGLAPKTVPNAMRGYLWALRVQQGDPWTTVQTESSEEVPMQERNSPEESLRTVRAA
jgi:hypothetical protein